ncbi:MAG: DUF3365 domain-containing protein [Nitrospirae bacterium]|nr:DUF3365 domain-containing protein [Nitrospirota bacterium]
MKGISKQISLSYSSTRFTLITIVTFIILSILIVFFFYTHHRQDALDDARSKALIILHRNLATHEYFSNSLKPNLFNLTEKYRKPDYFDPVWMSSTYAIREIDKIYQSKSGDGYYYKECAVNARTPENEADDFEKAFIQKLNSDHAAQEISGVRTINGKPFFYVLIKGETLEKTCMRCHSEPSKAPGGLVLKYGDTRSFKRSEGDIISAISIRIPIAAAYEHADKYALGLSALMVGMLVILMSLQLWLANRYFFSPLSAMRKKALEIISTPHRLGEEIPVPSGVELGKMAEAFNTMSHRLKRTLDELETRVRERTSELTELNKSLNKEIAERNIIEKERQDLIQELSTALFSVKALKGMLPICASCKKIRDDKGYWEEVASYISKHSDASFTHGICPDCLKKAYKDMKKLKKPDIKTEDGEQEK